MHRVPVHGIDLPPPHGLRYDVLHRPAMIKRQALGIHHAPQQSIAHGQTQHPGALHRPGRLAQAGHGDVRCGRHHTGATGQPMDVARRHQKCAVGRKPDHFRQHRRMPRHLHHALRAHGHTDAHGLQHQPGQPRECAARLQRRTFGHARSRVVHEPGPGRGCVNGHRHPHALRHPKATAAPRTQWHAANACQCCHRRRCPQTPPGSPLRVRRHPPSIAHPVH